MRFLFLILTLLIFSCNGSNDNKVDIKGCIYQNALNYDEKATIDDGSCLFDQEKFPIPQRRPKGLLPRGVLSLYSILSMIFCLWLSIYIVFKILSKIKLYKKINDDTSKFIKYFYWITIIVSWWYLFKLLVGGFHSFPMIYEGFLYDKPNALIVSFANFFIEFIKYIISFFK